MFFGNYRYLIEVEFENALNGQFIDINTYLIDNQNIWIYLFKRAAPSEDRTHDLENCP